MAESVFTGWRTITPGRCGFCGFADQWECDGRGSVLCSCQSCGDCGENGGWHNSNCIQLDDGQ